MGIHPIKTITFPGNRTFSIVIYDILFENTDCIVNAANGGLSHGGGIAAAISKAAGDALDDECDMIVREKGRIPVGSAVITTAGNLPFKGVIHAVGPRFGSGNEEDMIVSALKNSFRLAAGRGWKSLSFPAISSGIFSVPFDICAKAYVRAVKEYFEENSGTSLHTIRVCLHQGPLVDEVLRRFSAAEPVQSKAVESDDSEISVYELDFEEDE